MADTDGEPTGTPSETKPTEPLAPASTAVTVPDEPKDDSKSDAEALRAQLQKLEMERNLLRKKVDSTAKELDTKINKELEEKEDYRALAERATAQLDELLKEKQAAETKIAQEKATSEVFKEFDPKVVEVAQTADLSATDDSDAAKEALKTKLQAISDKLGTSAPKVTGSNPAPATPAENEQPDLTPAWSSMKGADWVQRGRTVTQNTKLANDQIRKLGVIDVMREQAGVQKQEV